jgi:coenzyme F420 hydrogenase subunit beta
MVDSLEDGRRPRRAATLADRVRDGEAMAACPGADQSVRFDRAAPGLAPELVDSWGPVLEMWEGWAADPRMRFRASSGGVISALGAWCVERGGMHGVLHVAARRDVPYLNETVMSRTRDEIVERSGSRYAPASPCDGLQLVEDAPGPCAFVGKPCDCLAVAKVRAIRPALDRNLGLVVGFFCAGTPTTAGTLEMLRRMGIEDPSRLRGLRYRGDGWPGKATAVVDVDGRLETRQLTYEQSWGDVLARHKQWRCNLCPDRTGETADIAVGDPWWGGVPRDAPGRSLVLARTERGRSVLRAAAADGYLALERAETWKLRASQPGFPKVRGAVWGRVAALRALYIPVPRYVGAALFRHWVRELTWFEKLKSVAGTLRRAVARALWRRRAVVAYEPAARGGPARM